MERGATFMAVCSEFQSDVVGITGRMGREKAKSGVEGLCCKIGELLRWVWYRSSDVGLPGAKFTQPIPHRLADVRVFTYQICQMFFILIHVMNYNLPSLAGSLVRLF